MALRYLAALALAALCLVTLALGLALEAGATLVGVAIVTGMLSLVALADGTVRRWRARRTPPAAR